MFTNDYFDDLCEKYALQLDTTDLDQLNLQQKLEEIKNFLKNELKKQYKLQEGAEKMRMATQATDKKRLNNLNTVIKETNVKIDQINQELLDLNSFIVITQSETSVDSFNSNFFKQQVSLTFTVLSHLEPFSTIIFVDFLFSSVKLTKREIFDRNLFCCCQSLPL